VIALTIAGFLALFVICNIVAYRSLVRLHPRRRPIVIALIIICNVVWALLPVIRNTRTDFWRLVRAVFGPPWFMWLSFVVVYSAFIAIVWWLPWRRGLSRAFLWTTLVALVVGVYQALVPLRVEHVTMRAGTDGIRIAELADLHVGLFTRPSRLEKIFATAVSLQPDVIVLAGDSIDDDPYYIPKLLEGMRNVPAQIPIVAVLGNHEMYGDPEEVIAKLRGSRVRLLVNAGFAIRDVWLAGISDYAGQRPELRPNLAAAIAGRGGRVPVVISHQPKVFDETIRMHLPVAICAHTHGGQCGIRPLHWSLAGVFLPYHMGLYERGGSQLYVNTGTGYWLVPWRLGMTPEIAAIDVRR
jgi:predicted MPP superfamily phosphohydrolase